VPRAWTGRTDSAHGMVGGYHRVTISLSAVEPFFFGSWHVVIKLSSKCSAAAKSIFVNTGILKARNSSRVSVSPPVDDARDIWCLVTKVVASDPATVLGKKKKKNRSHVAASISTRQEHNTVAVTAKTTNLIDTSVAYLSNRRNRAFRNPQLRTSKLTFAQ